MTLTQKALTLESDIIEAIKKLDPSFNLSERVRDYLRNYKNFISSNSLGYDVELLLKKREKFEDVISKTTAELDNLNNQIQIIQEKRKEKEEEQIKKEKEEADKLITCVICGIPKSDERLRQFPKGMVCHACYMSADHSTLKKFMGDKKS